MPAYFGRGYDIISGNPLSNDGVDPGFRNPIFTYTYNNLDTT
jgi:hypothetical protein